MKSFKILCIDGGGIKGLYSAQVLSAFEEHFGTLIADHFDLICGTSTGGIIALGAACEIPMKKIIEFYDHQGPRIFREEIKEKYDLRIGLADKLLGIKQALFSSKYDGTRLKNALVNIFKDRKMDEAAALLCIPTYNITKAEAYVFRNGPYGKDGKRDIVDVAMATSAAPTYFPIPKIGPFEYVDGGLWANNPTIIGLIEFLCNYLKPWENRGNQDYDGVKLLSISSCEKFTGQVSKRPDRSFWKWKDSIFDIYANGQDQSNNFLLKMLQTHLDFRLDITRVTHLALTDEQASRTSMDNASTASRKMLKFIGERTASRYAHVPEIIEFFKSPKHESPLQ